jgi:molecular chaperone DnaK
VVAFAKNDEVLVGEVDRRQAVINVDRTIRQVRRQLDRHYRQAEV